MTLPASQHESLASIVPSNSEAPDGRKVLKSRAKTLLADPPHPTADRDCDAEFDDREETVERRRQIDPTTCERDYSADEVEFMNAMNRYRRRTGRNFPTWSEVLEVVRSLGYHRD
ncbi:MAG TPA: hypothetical protein DDY91_10830 [Planctomycetaceae bacterium]|jgi:hypothetical protein|nr:hypothetical protein [Planctomycetaceae bacterium]